MEKLDPSVAQQIAQAAIAFQQQRTGREPQSVVVGESDGFHRLLRVKVLGIHGTSVKLGFEVDPGVPVHRSEVWKRVRIGRSPADAHA